MERLVSLSVGTTGAEDFFSTYQDMSELAANLGANHDYVSVTASVVNDDGEEEAPEELYHDEFTLYNAKRAIMKTGLSSATAEDVINLLQNAGFLIRELPPNKRKANQ